MTMKQDVLRKQVRRIKAEYDDIRYYDLAEYIGITEASFYNWLQGYYSLSSKRANKLHEIAIDLLELN